MRWPQAKGHLRAETGRGQEGSCPEPWEGVPPCGRLDFGLPASANGRGSLSVVTGPWVVAVCYRSHSGQWRHHIKGELAGSARGAREQMRTLSGSSRAAPQTSLRKNFLKQEPPRNNETAWDRVELPCPPSPDWLLLGSVVNRTPDPVGTRVSSVTLEGHMQNGSPGHVDHNSDSQESPPERKATGVT